LAKFLADLAREVAKQWHNLVAGDYVAPDCPPLGVLKSILESSYLAASTTEEGRHPQFNVIVTPRSAQIADIEVLFPFEQARPLSVSELRRLAPATDFKKSAIWAGYEGKSVAILGLVDLGTSWHRARLGFTYNYRVAHNLIVQADRPGRLKVYQGQFQVATLADGEISMSRGTDFHLFLHQVVNRGLERLIDKFSTPKFEHPRDFEGFWFIAHFNVFAAIANSISLSGHGGMMLILDIESDQPMSHLRVKYSGHADMLRDAFIKFINARNKTADLYEKAEQEMKPPSSAIFKAELSQHAATESLIEAIRFVAQLAGCDGGILLSPDLTLFGFGTEIRAEMADKMSVLEVVTEMPKNYKICDVEQFGMRHRSATKLVSQVRDALVLAISQDGPITAVWRDGSNVFVKRGVSLTNMNMPLA
jgi:hypothetical protein